MRSFPSNRCANGVRWERWSSGPTQRAERPDRKSGLECGAREGCLPSTDECASRFASRPAILGQVLGIVYRCIATHLIKKAGFSCKRAQTGAVTLIQRFGGALNIRFPMLFLDGV